MQPQEGRRSGAMPQGRTGSMQQLVFAPQDEFMFEPPKEAERAAAGAAPEATANRRCVMSGHGSVQLMPDRGPASGAGRPVSKN